MTQKNYLTTEEKAAAYDLVAKKVRDYYEGKTKMNSDVNEALDFLFPELREDKGERIKKALIRFFEDFPRNSIESCGTNAAEALEWIREQAGKDVREEKPTDDRVADALIRAIEHDYYETSDIFGVSVQDAVGWIRKKAEPEMPASAYTDDKDVIAFADEYSRKVWEKLMENFKKIKGYGIGCNDVSDIVLNAVINTWNRFKSKRAGSDSACDERRYFGFSEGDWIISTTVPVKITALAGSYVTMKKTDGQVVTVDVGWLSYYRRWKISDAKKGDILADRTKGDIVIIYKSRGRSSISSFCSYRQSEFDSAADGYIRFGFEPNEEDDWLCDEFVPATKEQRDMLMRQMENDGYKWNGTEFRLECVRTLPDNRKPE